MPCDERVGKGIVTWPCTLPPDHPGPHLSQDSQASVNERRRWAETQDALRRGAHAAEAYGLAQFQGPAQTTAERYTENATPVPISPGRARVHMACQPTFCVLSRDMWDECPKYDPKQAEAVAAPAEPLPGPMEEMPEPMTQRWPLPDGSGHVIERRSGGDFWVVSDDGEIPVTQREAIKMLAPVRVVRHPVRHLRAAQDAIPLLRQTFGDEIYIEVDPKMASGAWVMEDGGVPAPTKQRPGDQVLPDGTGVCVQDLVIEAMQESKRVGIERYGQTLRTFNGRKGFQDVHDEVRDLFVYLTQVKVEAEATREDLIRVVTTEIDKMLGGVFQGETGAKVAGEMATRVVDRTMGWVIGQMNS